jgi:hypothetical protein
MMTLIALDGVGDQSVMKGAEVLQPNGAAPSRERGLRSRSRDRLGSFWPRNCTMTKLSDTQLVILTAACSRDDRLVLPLPASLKGGAAKKVVHSLVTKGLIEEVAAGPDHPVWKGTDGDRRSTLLATDAAFAALNLELNEPATSVDRGQEPDAARRHMGVDRAVEGDLRQRSTCAVRGGGDLRSGPQESHRVWRMHGPE